MAVVGANAIMALNSYISIGKESAWGTYTTATAGLDFLSSNLTIKQEGKVLEEIVRNPKRAYQNRILMSKSVEGEIEAYYRPQSEACNYILINAFGGTVSSSAVSAAVAYLHELNVGDMESNKSTTTSSEFKALCVAMRKGDTAQTKTSLYTGLRVNELTLVAEIDEPVKFTAGLIGRDLTTSVADIASGVTYTSSDPLIFTGARVSLEGSVASLTASTYWHVQSCELKINNNLKADKESRRLGTNLLDVCPVGIMEVSLKLGLRFDTTTAYDAMVAGTPLSCELFFEGASLPTAATKESLKFVLPKIYVDAGADPEIGGADEILKCDIEFKVLYDATSTYQIKGYLTNAVASY